jgi:HAD superfamily hydrolase (TIGR01549 family)
MQTRAILWDVGGTLVDFASTLPTAVRSRLSACGVDHSRVSDDRIEQTYTAFIAAERTWRTIEHEQEAETQWLHDLLADTGLDPETISRVSQEMRRYFNLYKPVEGIPELLAELRARGTKLAIVSNWPPSLPEFLQHHALLPFFDAVIYSAQDGIHKPDPQIFLRALSVMHASPEDSIFIGNDLVQDIAGAKSLAMRTIHFDPRQQCETCDADETAGLRQTLWKVLEPEN